ncbi:Cu-oxidase-domain-containing protein [Phellopilus nigrolimitatus]|nr:Cu-oxidase-domain-containing protein [Phellopilus nigrolimitatus]
MHLRSTLRVVAAVALNDFASATIVSRTLNIVNANLAPDGVNRSTTVVDGQFPGPLITANVGDQFMLNVVDKLTNPNMFRSTSIHWHGLFQAHTPEMDGVAFVGQCPIVPDQSFLYNFQAPGQSGTYWYHSHLANQYCDGLRGPLVIYDPEDPLKYLYDIDDATTIITIADWYHELSTQLFPNPGKNPPNPDSTLINGLGRWANATGPPTPLAVVRAQPGKRHRFRIISTSCFPPFLFSIDQHNLTVIETDGVETQPYTIDTIQIEAAQRYSVIVTADKPVANYWIRAIPVNGDGNPTTVGGVNSAILRYDGAPAADPNSTAVANPVQLNEADVIPLINPGAPGLPFPGGADVNLVLTIGKDAVSGNFTINNVSFISPAIPVLLQILSGAVSAGSILPNTSVYSLPPNKTIEVSFPGAFPHPMHLHGHNFDIVRVAGSSTYNYVNPIRRDVLSVGGPTDNVTFRFVTNNPGPWFLHCHIDWHLTAGLALVFAEDAPDIPIVDPPNTQWEELCPLYAQLDPDGGLLTR